MLQVIIFLKLMRTCFGRIGTQSTKDDFGDVRDLGLFRTLVIGWMSDKSVLVLIHGVNECCEVRLIIEGLTD